MSHHSPLRRTALTAAVALVALLTAGGPASASRGGGGSPEDALARAVALQVNAAANVVAEAHGDQTNRASGASLVVPGILEVRTAQSGAETRVSGGLQARAESQLGDVHLTAAAGRLTLDLTALRTECSLDRRAGSARTRLVLLQATAGRLGLHGDPDGDGVLVEPAPNTRIDLGAGVSVVLNEQRFKHRSGRPAEITVSGAAVRIAGLVVTTLASSHCQLHGDPAPGGADHTISVPAVHAHVGPVDAQLQPEADTPARVEARVPFRARGQISAYRQAGAFGLVSFRAGAYVRAAGWF